MAECKEQVYNAGNVSKSLNFIETSFLKNNKTIME